MSLRPGWVGLVSHDRQPMGRDGDLEVALTRFVCVACDMLDSLDSSQRSHLVQTDGRDKVSPRLDQQAVT